VDTPLHGDHGHIAQIPQKELTGKLRQCITAYQGVDLTDQSRMTLSEWLDQWLVSMDGTVRPNTLNGYRSYIEMSLTADAYYAAYADSLVYEDADLRAAEADDFHAYSSFTYNYYYLAASRFLEGGTTAEDGTVTYSDEETAASVAAAKEAAISLTGDDITTVDELNAAIAALPVNKDNASAVSTYYDDNAAGNITGTVYNWLSDDARKEGDLAYLENSTTDAEGNTTINGYYVVYFHSINDNTFALKNVRHILVNFEGGTTDENGVTTYSDEEKAATKAKAEEILAEFEAGDGSIDSFATLATLKSGDTGSTANGGLYEDVYPGQMVPAFENWCYDESRKPGDTGIVETEYGYHVMYFVGDGDVTYRDYQITEELRASDISEWRTSVENSMTVTDGDFSYIPLNMVLTSN